MPAFLPRVKRQMRSDALVRLLCLPAAGGGAATFHNWSALLPPSIEVCAVEYPGRGTRRAEKCIPRLSALVTALAEGVSPVLANPYAVFGHCLGALLGFELVRRVSQMGLPQPVTLIVAGARAPSNPLRKPIHALADDELREELRLLGGTPDELLTTPQAARFFFRALRADLEAAETYEYASGPKLMCPIRVYAGREDSELRAQDLEAWLEETERPGGIRVVAGDHFFVQRAESSVVGFVADDVLEALQYGLADHQPPSKGPPVVGRSDA